MNKKTPTTDILKNIKLLVSSILLLISSFIVLILWQESEQDSNYDIEKNYHAATSSRLSGIHQEILNIKSNINLYANRSRIKIEIKNLNQNTKRSLHIISQNANDVYGIQEKYQNPIFSTIKNRLQEQLKILITLKDMREVTVILSDKLDSTHLDATILTLNQFERLHKIAKSELFKSMQQKENNHLMIVFMLIVAVLLASAFITYRTIKSIKIILTHNKHIEENLRRTKKMDALGQLTGGVAHDYNNMLGVILGYAELLEVALSDQPKLLNYANQIRHASQRGAKLTSKLLDFSAYKTHKPEEINLNELIDNQQNLLQKILTAQIDLKLDLDDDLWSVWVDKSDLEDAIINLCINAKHAIKGNGKLTIHTCNKHVVHNDYSDTSLSVGDYICLSFTDSGCGMDSLTKENMFDPFYTTKGEKGTGLGLSQVHGFMERNKGDIEVESEIGRGSQFVLYFPRDHDVKEDQQGELKQVVTTGNH